MIKCNNCGESNEKNLDLSYDHSLNGVVYCTCKSCKSKFVVQEGEGAILGKYISDRSKFFKVLESAKLTKDYSGSPTYELRRLVDSYSSVAEIDPIYHWYKIEIITKGFTDRSKVGEAEKEFLKIPERELFFVSKEDETRHEQYSRLYAVYKQEIQSEADKRRKKKRRIIKLVISLLVIIALAGAALGIYSCYNNSLKYTFALNYGEAEGSVASVEAKAGNDIEGLPPVILSDEKYYIEFTGWYTEKDCGGIRITDAEGNSELKLDSALTSLGKDKVIQLYAGYKYKQYTVTFYSADGSSVIKTVKAVYGAGIEQIGTGITYGDITVVSWTKQIGGSAFAGKVENDTALYALSREVNLSFETDGANELPAQAVKVGDTVTLPSPEKQYYSFEGWLADGVNVGTSYTVPEKKVTLTAQWKRTHYEVSFDTDGVTQESPQMVRVGGTVTLPSPLREYYTVTGWTCEGVLIDTSFVMPEKDIKLIAQWKKTHYQVTFDTDGVSEESPQMVRVGGAVTLPSPEKQYYSFEGWTCDGALIDTSFVMPEKDITLVAQWTRTHYSVTYDSNGGESVESAMTRVGTDVALPVLTRQYYRFKGWTYGGNLIEHSLEMPERNVTLVARWEKTHNKVTFYNTHDSTSVVEYVLIGESCSVPQAESAGYEFISWVAPGGTEYKVSITPSDDITLNSTWSAKYYEVTYDANGGTVTGATGHTVRYGNAFDLLVPVRVSTTESYTYKYSKNGAKTNTVNMNVQYIFEGWYTSAEGGTKLTDKIGKGVSVWNIAKNTTAYAHWTPLTVKYHKDTNMRVYDDEDRYDLAATTNVKAVIGYSVAELKALGYTKLNLNMFLNYREIDDGYQELYILKSYTSANAPANSNILWKKTDMEHTSGNTDTTSWTHYLTASLDLSKVSEDLYFVVNANGKEDDDWFLNYVDLFFTVA